MLSELHPHMLWKWFSKICSIPHSSYNDEELVSYIENWANSKGLNNFRDNASNLIICKDAKPGYENLPSICLQAHVDMVPQKTPESKHDFLKDPILPRIVDGHIFATNTTLGADNGIGVASLLALLEDKELNHGPLEILLTRNEEVGMEGAIGLEANKLKSKFMINTDTEEWGYLYLGCAGGVDVTFTQKLKSDELISLEEKQVYTLGVSGLQGGHSGCDIHKGRLNAIRVGLKVAQLLFERGEFNIIQSRSGTARNAIPRDFILEFSTSEENYLHFSEAINDIVNTVLQDNIDPNIKITFGKTNTTSTKKLSTETTINLLNCLNEVPNGVISTIEEGAFKGTVETSLSVGMFKINPDEGISYKVLARSLDNEKLNELTSVLKHIVEKYNFECVATGQYSGWKPEYNDFSNFVLSEYEKVYGHKVETAVIHAGLECGILKGKYPEMKIVSIGPNIYNPHTPTESVEIKSVEEYYKLLKNIVANCKL